MYIASIVQTIDLTILVLLSLFTGVMIWEGEGKAAIMMYIAISLLSFFLIPNKFLPFGYIIFFGWYGILNGLLTRKVNKWIRFGISIGIFSIILVISVFLYESLIGVIPFKLWLVFLVGVPIFILYFFVYDKLLIYYNQRFRKYFLGGKR